MIGRRLRRCVKRVLAKLNLDCQRLQIGSAADDFFQIQKPTADTIYPLPAAERSRRGAWRRIAAQLTRDRNSAFRIPNSEL